MAGGKKHNGFFQVKLDPEYLGRPKTVREFRIRCSQIPTILNTGGLRAIPRVIRFLRTGDTGQYPWLL